MIPKRLLLELLECSVFLFHYNIKFHYRISICRKQNPEVYEHRKIKEICYCKENFRLLKQGLDSSIVVPENKKNKQVKKHCASYAFVRILCFAIHGKTYQKCNCSLSRGYIFEYGFAAMQRHLSFHGKTSGNDSSKSECKQLLLGHFSSIY